MLYYYNCYSIAINRDPIYNLSSNFHTKIATQLYKIISDAVIAAMQLLNKLSFEIVIYKNSFIWQPDRAGFPIKYYKHYSYMAYEEKVAYEAIKFNKTY